MSDDLEDIPTDELVRELTERGHFDYCQHSDDCDCICSLSDADTDDMLNELYARNELNDEGPDRHEVEYGYEELLRGNYDDAIKYLKRALHPNGEADVIANRVRQDQKAAAAETKKAA